MNSRKRLSRRQTINDLYKIAARHDILLESLPLHQADSVVVCQDDDYIIAMNSSRRYTGANQKTMLAHELGHCATGSLYNEKTPIITRSKCERRADEWAIKLLIPRDKLCWALRNGYKESWELADFFDVHESLIRKAIEFYFKRK